MGDHIFATPSFFPQAFVGTRFAFVQGFAQAEIPDYPLTQNRKLDVDMVGVAERIEISLRLFDRVMPFIRVTGEAFSGISSNSVISVGTSYSWTAGGGLQVKILRLEEPGTELSVRAAGDYGPGGTLQLLRLVEALVADAPSSVEALLDGELRRVTVADTERASGSFQLLAAQTISRNFGAQAAIGGAYNWNSITFYDTETNEETTLDTGRVDPKLGLGVGANAMPWVPVGLLLEYSLESSTRSIPGEDFEDRHYSHILALGAHLVHPQFDLGITAARAFGLDPVQRTGYLNRDMLSGDPSINYLQMNLEFTWW
jgi:hypothetical protein